MNPVMRRGSWAASAVLAASVALHAVPASEIRITREEGYGAVSSQLSIRPDSAFVIKHFDAMQRPGDTIGGFACAGGHALFTSLWADLEKASQVTGIPPDSRVMAVTGTRAGKTREFIIPLSPPVPAWAREFANQTDSVETEALSHPVFALTLAVKPLASKRKQKAQVMLVNPGTRPARIPKGASIQLQVLRKPESEGWPAGGPIWDSLATIRMDADRDLPAGKPVVLERDIALEAKGGWYYRAFYRASGSMSMDTAWVRGEAYSALDSVVVK